MYIIAEILVDKKSDKVIIRTIQVGNGIKVLLLTDTDVIKLADRGEIVVGVNENRSVFKSELENVPKYVLEKLNEMNQRISNQIPVVTNEYTVNQTAIAMKKVGETLYDVVCIDSNCIMLNIRIDTSKKVYRKGIWNIRRSITDGKILEILGLKSATERSMQIKAKVENISISNLKDSNKNWSKARFWVVGINYKILEPDENITSKEFANQPDKKFIYRCNECFKVVDLGVRNGDKFRVINMSHDEVRKLSLYANVGNMEKDEMKYFTFSEGEPFELFGEDLIFVHKVESLYAAWNHAEDLGMVPKEIYNYVLDVKRKEIDSLKTCIGINEIRKEAYELTLLTCDGSIKKITVNISDKIKLRDIAKKLNITNITIEASNNKVINNLQDSFVGYGRYALELGESVSSCGICVGNIVYDDYQSRTRKGRVKAYLFNREYTIEIRNHHEGMTVKEIKDRTRFRILDCKEDELMSLTGITNKEDMKQVYIGISYYDQALGRICEEKGFVINEE